MILTVNLVNNWFVFWKNDRQGFIKNRNIVKGENLN